MSSSKLVLSWADYGIFLVTLVISSGIGIYFQFRGNTTNEEYLLGGRNMPPLPVAFSILATFMSATNLMGLPAEMYLYGSQLIFINLSFAVTPVLSNYLFLPIFFNNDFTSAYEYLEKRFGKATRRLLSAMFSLQIGLFTSATLYAPALALSAVTDLSLWVSILSIGAVCTFYCTLGGMKAVLWTDVFQALLMITTLVTVIVFGCVTLGGVSNIFQIANEGGRLLVPSTKFDIGKHYTMYNVLVQGVLFGLSTYGGSQIALQRLMSVKSLHRSRIVTLMSIPMCVGFNLMCSMCGLIVYAYFRSCDPIQAPDKQIESPDQLMPLFITSSMSHLPGLPGLCVAGIFSASLSTVSSAVNSLAAVTYEDFVQPLFPGAHKNPVLYTKLLSLLYGVVCIGLSFLMSTLGNLVKLTILIYGMFAGPNLAVFLLAACTTTANQEGVVVGLLVSLGVGAYLNFVPDSPPEPSLPVSLESCPLLLNNATSTPTLLPEDAVDPFPIAYMWFSTITLLTCLVISYLASMVVACIRGKNPEVSERYLSPMRTWFFKRQRKSRKEEKDSKSSNQRDTTL